MKFLCDKYMYKILLMLCLVGLPILAFGQAETITASNRRQFQEIASKLDVGGDLFLVVNTDKFLDRLIKGAIAANVGIPADDPHEKEIRETLTRLNKFLTRNGFAAVHGVGMSSVPVAEGVNAVKFYISRDYIDSNLPLWRGLIGWQPRRLISLDFIPADTVMARAATPELNALWKVSLSAIDEVAPDSTKAMFKKWRENLNATMGVDLSDLLNSIRDEIMIAVRFSKTEQSLIPAKRGAISIPAPSFLIVIGTDNEILKGIVEARLAKYNVLFNESKVGDVLMRTARNKLPSLIPMQPAYASEAGFFLLGSTPDIVADALEAYQHKNGLKSRSEFKKAFQGLSMVNNGIIYVSPEMGQIIGHIRSSNIDKVVAGTEKHPVTSRIIRQLLTYNGKDQSAALVIQNWKNGIMVMGNSAIGGQDALMRLIAYPLQSLPKTFFATKESNKKTLISIFRNTFK